MRMPYQRVDCNRLQHRAALCSGCSPTWWICWQVRIACIWACISGLLASFVARVPQMGRADAFAWAAPLSQKLFHSDEAKEGIAAFKEKRDAAWVTGG